MQREKCATLNKVSLSLFAHRRKRIEIFVFKTTLKKRTQTDRQTIRAFIIRCWVKSLELGHDFDSIWWLFFFTHAGHSYIHVATGQCGLLILECALFNSRNTERKSK